MAAEGCQEIGHETEVFSHIDACDVADRARGPRPGARKSEPAGALLHERFWPGWSWPA